MRLLPFAIAASLLVLAPGAARAQRKPPPPPKVTDPGTAQAKRLFDDGAAAYAKGNYEEAIHFWEQSYELSRRPLIFESIANAYERLGDPRKARDYLSRWREAAPRDEWELLDDRIKNLDARVKREEQLEAERRTEEERARRAQAAREQAIRAAAAPKDAGAPLPAMVLMGVGGAAVAVGLTFDTIAAIRRPNAKTACAQAKDGTELCRSDQASAIQSSNTFATVGDVTWIAGAVVGAAGTVWFFTKRRAPAQDAASTTFTPFVGPRGAALSLSHAF
jgi:tetratricopeptide (TPR) repeat protein